ILSVQSNKKGRTESSGRPFRSAAFKRASSHPRAVVVAGARGVDAVEFAATVGHEVRSRTTDAAQEVGHCFLLWGTCCDHGHRVAREASWQHGASRPTARAGGHLAECGRPYEAIRPQNPSR